MVCGDEWMSVDEQIAFAVDRRLKNPANWQTVTEPGKTPDHHRVQDQSIEGEALPIGNPIAKYVHFGAP
jgi:hypothetical protein